MKRLNQNKMRKILKTLYVIQVVSNKDRDKNGLKRLGDGHFQAYRFNPYNPLSYLSIILIVSIGLFMFGFIGFWKQIDSKNPFKWN
jgi:hypothetical protein